jgi:hypothetical protein
MILSGDLKDFSLADVLQLLLQQRKSGVLHLENGRERAELYISQGNINGVRVNGGTPEAKVRDMLVENGRMGAREAADLERVSEDMGRPLLATLIAKGYLSEADREEWLQIISEDMVCELFSWQGGKYEFGTGLKAQAASGSHMNLSTEFACMEGMRRIDEWPRLREAIPDGRSVFSPTGRPYQGDELGWDRLVYDLVDGRKPVGHIARLVPFGSFRLAECLVNLWNGGFISPVQGAGLEQEQAVRADPVSEKDRKTAMVVGASVLIFVAATAVRLIALWMMNVGAPGPAGSEARITRSLARENVEAFLIDHAARHDAFPEALDDLVRSGGLRDGDIRGSAGGKTIYRRTSDGKGYVLR